VAKRPYPIVPVGGFPPQKQATQPGIESIMVPRPIAENPYTEGSGKLKGRVAIISGGDSGIGRAVAVAFAKEGADVVIVYLNEYGDAAETKARIEALGQTCLPLAYDLTDPGNSLRTVKYTIRTFGHMDILVNNCAISYVQPSLMDISNEQMEQTFRVNVFSYFYLTKACLPYLSSGSSIINTASVTPYIGYETLIDYTASKGAVVGFTRSLASNLVKRGIRVNAVAPGYTWTPLIPAGFPPEEVATFGLSSPSGRAAQPFEIAPAYVYLASDDSSYVTGEVIHVNGGMIVNG
jgi:NAD(P)-dependent dehydrogenase (short-subunit alcohol dehydrogenase family)